MEQRTLEFNHQPLTIFLRDEADRSVANEIFKFREYRLAEECIKTATTPIVDVGAHSGLFTLFARSLNPLVPIIAVEPEKNNVTLLKQHLKENNIKNVTVIEAALGGKTGKDRLLVMPDSHNHRLVPPGASKAFTTSETIPVQAYSLAYVLEHFVPTTVSVLKMDIEGGEYEVFKHSTLEELSKIKAIIMEYHTLPGKNYQAIEQKLRENGFGVQTHPSRFDKTMGFLFATNKRI